MRNIAIAMACFALMSCAAAGVKISDEQLRSLEKGKTTIGDVMAKFGPPSNRMVMGDGTTIVSYMYVEASARPETFIPYVGVLVGGADSRSKLIQLKFNQAGVLDNQMSSESNMGMGMGFASGMQAPVERSGPRQVE